MKIRIVKDSNPIMRKKSEPVALPLSQEDKQILDEMLQYLKLSQDEEYAAKHNIKPGVGMAAIQAGVLKRMFVIYYKTNKYFVAFYITIQTIVNNKNILVRLIVFPASKDILYLFCL